MTSAFDPLLLILNPRHIDDCITSLERLQIPKAWLTGYTERQLVAVIAAVIEETQRSHYLIVSDDAIVTQTALDSVLELLAAGHPVVTGWCNLDATDPRINLGTLEGDHPTKAAYHLYDRDKVDTLPDPMPTEFAGMAFTGMSRELWVRFPFDCHGNNDEPGFASDFHLCTRLKQAGIPIVAPKAGGVHHVKEVWSEQDTDPAKRLLIGHVTPQVTYT